MDPSFVARPPEPPVTAPHAGLQVEGGQRLSRSALWRLQRGYYDRVGVDAWRTHGVPYFVTNNCALARAYAAVVLGFLRDCARATPPLDPRAPVTVVELGAGSGRFAYLFLKAFREMHRRSAVAGVRLRYVMTDFTESNLRFWREHPQLRPFVEQGLLDFALFDAERDQHLELVEARERIGPGDLANPLCVIANYVFDGIAQDAFTTEGGALREYLVSLEGPGAEIDGDEPAPGEGHGERPEGTYYGDAELDAVLQRCAAGPIEGPFLLPHAAIRCARRLAALAEDRLLLLSADYGSIDAAERWVPGMALHGGCFSLPVNYHAIAEWARGRGGRVLTAEHRHLHLVVAAFLLGDYAGEETRLAYAEAVETAGPDDWHTLQESMLDGLERLGLDAILATIRISAWDAHVVQQCLPALWRHLADADAGQRREVLRILGRALANHYALGEACDLAFELGLLAHGYGGFAEALTCFGESLRLEGDDARTRWNMGLCHWALGRSEDALTCFRASARLDPAFVPVGTLQIKEPDRAR